MTPAPSPPDEPSPGESSPGEVCPGESAPIDASAGATGESEVEVRPAERHRRVGGPLLAERLDGPVVDVAPTLLGMHLAVSHDEPEVVIRIEEVEAYDQDDPASHTFRGRTSRNAVMFGPPGHAYVYRSHGIHLCLNVVCGPEGHGSAALVRGGTVVAGRGLAVERRSGRDGDAWLAAGPGRLCQALGIRAGDDGAWLLGEGPVRLIDRPMPTIPIVRGPRVGVTRAPDRPWRFWLDGAPGVSKYRRSPRAPSPPP